jgi:tetratricopeptide (TPR) repeat protein
LSAAHQEIFTKLPKKPSWGVYTCDVHWRTQSAIFSLLAAVLISVPCRAQQADSSSDPVVPQTGVILPHELCPRAPGQSYALYLPSNYDASQRWPIIYLFDPLARGEVPLQFMKAAADRYGFILVGSNNSQNGPWKPEIDAAQAMLDDTRMRFAIDEGRIYFSGFSGGARVAARIAMLCKCAAGVMLNGAGFPSGEPPNRDSIFSVFASVGDSDYNYPEVTKLDRTLDSLGVPHFLRHFDGPHRWAPEPVMDDALAWFRITAMKQNREPRNPKFIAEQKEAALARAHAFEQANDPYAAMLEYQQSAAALDGLTDVSAFRQAASALASQKAVRNAQKQQAREMDQQASLVSDIAAGLRAMGQPSSDLVSLRSDTSRKIVDLRERAAHEKRLDQVRVLQRAVADVFALAIESGLAQMDGDKKDYSLARDYFLAAVSMRPKAAWAYSNLATAYAQLGDRKAALDALRHAKETTSDSEAFDEWLKTETAFSRLREDPVFRSLLFKP